MISFPDFFEKAPLAILIVAKGKIVKYNPAFTKVFEDLPAGDILNKPITNFVNPYHNYKETNWKTGKFLCTINRPNGQRKVEVSIISNTDDLNTHTQEDYWIISPAPDAFHSFNKTVIPQEGVFEENKEN